MKKTTLQTLRTAYLRGCAGASALEVGHVFYGALPAGEQAGYVRGTPEMSSFIDGYLDVLQPRFPMGVATDGDHRVVEGF